MMNPINSITISPIKSYHKNATPAPISPIIASRASSPIVMAGKGPTQHHTSPITVRSEPPFTDNMTNDSVQRLVYGHMQPSTIGPMHRDLQRLDSDNENTPSSNYEFDTDLGGLIRRSNPRYNFQTPIVQTPIIQSPIIQSPKNSRLTQPDERISDSLRHGNIARPPITPSAETTSEEVLTNLRKTAKMRLPIQKFMHRLTNTDNGNNNIKYDPSTELTSTRRKKLEKCYVQHASGVLLKENKRTTLYNAGNHAWFANEAYLRKPNNFISPNTGEHFLVKHTSNDSKNKNDGNTWCIWQHQEGDKNKLVVGFQGTNMFALSLGDVGRDLQSIWQTKLAAHTLGSILSDDYPNAKTGYGFMERHSTQIESLKHHIDALDPEGRADIVFAGHSLGASMSQLTGLLYSKEHPNKNVEVEAYNCPNTGNKSLQKAYREHVENSSTLFSSNTYNIKNDPFSDYIRRPDMHQLDPNTAREPSRGNIVDNHRMDNWEGTPYRTTP